MKKFEQKFALCRITGKRPKIQNAAKNVSEIEDAVGEELTDLLPRVTETETEEKKKKNRQRQNRKYRLNQRKHRKEKGSGKEKRCRKTGDKPYGPCGY